MLDEEELSKLSLNSLVVPPRKVLKVKMGRGPRPIKKGPRARRRKHRRKEGIYASSVPVDDGGVLRSDSGLTLFPESQVQKTKVVENESKKVEGAVINEPTCDSPKPRRSVRLALRIGTSTTDFTLESGRDGSTDPSSPQHNTSGYGHCGSNQGDNTIPRKTTELLPLKTTESLPPNTTQLFRHKTTDLLPRRSTISFPIISIEFPSMNFASIPIVQPTHSHTSTGSFHPHLLSSDKDMMSFPHMANYSFSSPAIARRTHPISPIPSPLAYNANPTSTMNGSIGIATNPSPNQNVGMAQNYVQASPFQHNMYFPAMGNCNIGNSVHPGQNQNVGMVQNYTPASPFQHNTNSLTMGNGNFGNTVDTDPPEMMQIKKYAIKRLVQDFKGVQFENQRMSTNLKTLNGEKHVLETQVQTLRNEKTALEVNIEALNREKTATQFDIQRLNDTNLALNHELGFLRNQIPALKSENNAIKNELQALKNENIVLKNASLESDEFQSQFGWCFEGPPGGTEPFVPQMPNSSGETDNNGNLALKQATEKHHQEMAQMKAEMAHIRHDRDRFQSLFEKIQATQTESTQTVRKTTPENPKARSIMNILETFRVENPQSNSRAEPQQSQAPKLLTPDLPLPAQSISPTQPIWSAQSFTPTQPVSTFQSLSTQQSVLTPHQIPTSQSLTIDLTVEDPNLSAPTLVSQKRKYSWLDHHPLSKDPHPRGYLNLDSTPAARLQARLGSGLVDPTSGVKSKKIAKGPAKKAVKEPAKKPSGETKGRTGKKNSEDRPAKKQRLGKEKDTHQAASVFAAASDDNGTSAGTNTHEPDGLDEEMDREWAAMLEDNANKETVKETAAMPDEDGLDEEMARALAEMSEDGLDEEVNNVAAAMLEEPAGTTEEAVVLPPPKTPTNGEDGDHVDKNGNDDCPFCEQEGGHGGEKCLFADDEDE